MSNQVDQILEQIQRHIARDDLNAALNELRTWVEALTSDLRIMGNVFGSRDLDRLCLQIGELASNFRPPSADSDKSQASIDCVFVASEFYMTGGHTALVEDYIQALPGKTSRVLITDADESADRNAIMKRLSTVTNDVRFSPLNSSALTKLNWLIDELRNATPAWTLFINHPHDAIATAGMHQSLSKRRAFVHHADHTFTLGLFVEVDKHIDFRALGWNNCRHHLGITNNDLIALSVPDQGVPASPQRFLSDGKVVTCTSGNNKFEFPYSFQLANCIPQWLASTGGRHIHIGQLSPSVKDAINRRLQDMNISTDRLTIVPWVESVWQSLIAHKVDFYIDSFPLCGCRALVEAMGAGVPVAVHHSYRHSLFSNEGFAYDSAFIWNTPEQLNEHLKSIDVARLDSQSQQARLHYLDNHVEKFLSRSLEKLLNDATTSGFQPSSNFDRDPLRAFFDGFADPVPMLNGRTMKRMLKWVSLAKSVDLPAGEFEQTLELQTSPTALERYRKYYKELGNQVKVMELIEDVYPLTADNQLDKERLSRMLFAISQLADAPESVENSNQAKLLHRIKGLARKLVGMARSPR